MNDILEVHALNFDLTLGLHSKGALVLGTASGIGSKTVELLAGDGVHVVTDDSNSTVMEMEREGQIAARVESWAPSSIAGYLETSRTTVHTTLKLYMLRIGRSSHGIRNEMEAS